MNKMLVLLYLTSVTFGYSQENKFSRSAIKTGVAIGYNISSKEEGLGTFSMVGYEQLWKKRALAHECVLSYRRVYDCSVNFGW